MLAALSIHSDSSHEALYSGRQCVWWQSHHCNSEIRKTSGDWFQAIFLQFCGFFLRSGGWRRVANWNQASFSAKIAVLRWVWMAAKNGHVQWRTVLTLQMQKACGWGMPKGCYNTSRVISCLLLLQCCIIFAGNSSDYWAPLVCKVTSQAN